MDGHRIKKYSLFCFALFCVFYTIQVSVLGYTVYFLNANGFSAAEIGTLIAVFGIVGAIRQLILGAVADNNEKINFKIILIFGSIVVSALFIGMYFFANNKFFIGLFFGLVFVFTNSMSPFVNVSCFYNGIKVDFGKARAFGSFSFAVFSYILGILTNKYGARVISINGIIASLLLLAVMLFMPKIESERENLLKDQNSKNENKNTVIDNPLHLITKYPSFFLMLLSIVFAICFQNADCGYLINIITELGGDSSNLGIANAIAAMVEIPIMFLINRIMKKINAKKLMVVACAFYVLRGIVFHIPSIAAIYVAQFMQMFSYAILITTSVYLVDEMIYDEDKNKGHTLVGAAVTIGLIFGSFIGGQFISRGGTDLLEVGCIVIGIISFVFAVLGNISWINCNEK